MKKPIIPMFFLTFCTVCFSPLSFANKNADQLSNPNSGTMAVKQNNEKNTTDKILYLFVQGSKEATLIKNKEANQTMYSLALKNVNPYVTVFTERPARQTKLIPLKKYLDFWNNKNHNNFRADPPNAAFHAILRESKNQEKVENYILELNSPQYNAATKTLTYSVKPLQGNTASLPETAISLHQAILFIDDAVCLSCW